MSIEHSIEILKETIENLKEHKPFSYSNEEKIAGYEIILHLISSQKNGLLRDNVIIEKQQKEIEELKKPKYIIDCKTNEITTLTNDFVSKDKIKEKIEEITSYAYTSAEERDCQDYAIQVLKELLGE